MTALRKTDRVEAGGDRAPARSTSRRRASTKLRKALVADLLCGAGGSSTGAARALRHLGWDMELTCVNHWPVAIETHKRNHPSARHYVQDIAAIRPLAAVPEGYLDLLMASPTCTHHSRARGGRPTSDQQRSDPWHIVTWLTELRVKRLLIENVPEFLRWGPVNRHTGRPVKSREGEYFYAWVKVLKGLGFRIDYRVLNCADYGDATTRQRFFLIGRSDGKPLRWPEPTHSREGGRDLLGERERWRAAREIIDWDRPGRSIFTRPRPLVPKTLARIHVGGRKFHWPEPFLVILRRHMDAASVDAPLPTITASGTHIGLAQPALTPFLLAQGQGGVARDVGEPAPTIVGGGALSLTEPVLISVTGGERPKAARSLEAPLGTITTRNGLGLAAPLISPYYGSGSGESCKSVQTPLDTVTGKARFGLVEPVIITVAHGNAEREKAPNERRVQDPDQPLPSITASGGQFAVAQAVAEPFVVSPRHGKDGAGPRPRAVSEPLPTVTAGGSQMAVVEPVAEPFILNRHGDNGSTRAHSVEEPTPTSTGRGAGYVVEPVAEPFLLPQRSGGPDRLPIASVDQPLPTVTHRGAGDLVQPVVEPLIVQTDQTGGRGGYVRSASDPLYTAVSKQNQALVEPILQAMSQDEDLRLAAEQGRLFLIDGVPHLFDIRFRMLEPYELARAMGFSDDEADYEFVGNKTEITKQIGNAVPVGTATALVRALFAD